MDANTEPPILRARTTDDIDATVVRDPLLVAFIQRREQDRVQANGFARVVPHNLEVVAQDVEQPRLHIVRRDTTHRDLRPKPKFTFDFEFGVMDAVREWWFKGRVDGLLVGNASYLLQDHDHGDGDILETQDLDRVPEPHRAQQWIRRHHFASKLARECQFEIPGIMANTRANQLVAHNWLVKRCAELNVRKSHCREILPRFLLYVRTATLADVEAEQLACTPAFVLRAHDAEQTYTSRGPSTLLSWFGRKYNRPRPRAA